MNFASLPLSEFVGALVGFTLTLMILSYTLGDNPLFRLALHIFVGVAAGYTVIITMNNVILPQLIIPLLSDNQNEKILAVIYLIPSALVLTKLSPRLSRLGNPAMAILVGIGAAAAIGGAVLGTVFPQAATTINLFASHNSANAAVILIATLTTLIYFHFSWQRESGQTTKINHFIRGIGKVGQIFIAITFGSLFTGVYFSALAAYIERLNYIWSFLRDALLPAIFAR